MGSDDHTSVCSFTYRRFRFLERLLKILQERAEGKIKFAIVVVDNDRNKSAKPVVDALRQLSHVAIEYFVELEKSFALAHNRVVEEV